MSICPKNKSSKARSDSRRTGEDFTALYNRADKALYRAKGQGKGVVCRAEEFE